MTNPNEYLFTKEKDELLKDKVKYEPGFVGQEPKFITDATKPVHHKRTELSYDMPASELKSDALHNEGLATFENDPRYL